MKRDRIVVVVILFLSFGLYWLPSQFEPEDDGYVRAQGRVLSVDNEHVYARGVVRTGVQEVVLQIADGPYEGKTIVCSNTLLGKLEMDKMFAPGDTALVTVKGTAGEIQAANVVDHYRLYAEGLLFFLFATLLCWYARWTGLKALLSFVFTVLVLWKVLWPLFLLGWDPVLVSVLVVAAIVGTVTLLVIGFNRIALAAFCGTIGGALGAVLLAFLFGQLFRVHGAVLPYAETLLHMGYAQLDLTRMFFAGIMLASSGAMMDVAVDIAVAVGELKCKRPDLARSEAIASGMHIGRAVVGTMTTTLLLAYSGSFMALMLVFIAQGTPVVNILNLTYVAAEILHTLTGSIGVVLAAPCTALLAGMLLAKPSAVPACELSAKNP